MCVELCIQSNLVTALVLLSKVTANTEPLLLGASDLVTICTVDSLTLNS